MSQLWIRYTDKNESTSYIRGTEVTAVEARTYSGSRYGKPVEDHVLRITVARTIGHDGGTEPESRDLWQFSSRQRAENAAATLVRLLAIDAPAVVFQHSETSKLARISFHEPESGVEADGEDAS